MVNLEPSESLLEGRRYLEWLADDCEIIKDYSFEAEGRWLLKIRLKNKGQQSSYIPKYSDWHVFIDDNYPNGKIQFYPSKINGIGCVFPHQSPHLKNISDHDYYDSNICLEQFSPSLEVKMEEGNSRLYNYTKKALEWIKQAANGVLLAEGDYFEKVAYPTTNFRKKVLFSEDEASFSQWNKYDEYRVGFLNMKSGKPGTVYQDFMYVTDYYKGISGYKKKGAEITSYSWGKYVMNEKSRDEKGVWIKLLSMPYIEPWQAPENWSQLIKIFEENNVNFTKDVMPFLNNLRDRNSHIMMLGFPISERVNGQISEMHWQSLELPILSDSSTPEHFFKGFRKDIKGYEMADMRRIFLRESVSLEWISSENWSPDNLVSRGNLSKNIKKLKFLFVGVGALGSVLSETLVRSGVEQLDIVDSDILEIGNLTRHTLAATDIGKYKAISIEKRLTKSFIHYKGNGFSMSIEEFLKKQEVNIDEYDVIIETTGNDKVLDLIVSKKLNGLVISTSLGLHAKRMYINIQRGNKVVLKKFKENIQEWLERDRADFSNIDYPRDGLGCWHPLFPARMDHLSLLASSAVSIIESDILHLKESLTIIERGELGTVSILKRKEFADEN
ncbi:ThiF family adenylyltransferase [Candidatus Enterococcus lemimoniae]|uniref:THIF-type NAD/FAD binding fold domain-containing protein n=1 Tax=Candidatus Enterococcus lemimoniae TaxID=1834167 RepID=A0ABZ2T3C8_9ENTE|nr:ThiF family adenylyltransferase [Enterococcus sp. 12C11_DIV0727]OTO68894.1 hypothetical protein A5866_001093 [Enterococcus sp. 12C11_DIV0727]